MKKLTLILSVLLLVVGCKKNSDESADPNPPTPPAPPALKCKINTLTDANQDGAITLNLTYDNDGRISTTRSTGSGSVNKVYTYAGSTILINVTDEKGKFSAFDSITLNSDKKPLYIRHYRDELKTDYDNTELFYNGDGTAQKYIQTYTTGPDPSTSIFTWANGDLVEAVTGTYSVKIEYYTDKPNRDGDYFNTTYIFQYGVDLFKSAHLVKSVSDGTNIFNMSYDIAADGKISKATITRGSNIETVTYGYDCR